MLWYGDAGWTLVVHALWMLLFWGSFLALVIWVVSAPTGPRQTQPTAETPLGMMERRYAAGEMSEAEFERARHTLSQAGAHTP